MLINTLPQPSAQVAKVVSTAHYTLSNMTNWRDKDNIVRLYKVYVRPGICPELLVTLEKEGHRSAGGCAGEDGQDDL